MADLNGQLIDCFGLLVEIIEDEHLQHDDKSMGEYCERTKTIRLAPHDNDFDQMQTLLHECFHAYTKRSGVIQGISEELDETIADGFATLLVENFDIKLR